MGQAQVGGVDGAQHLAFGAAQPACVHQPCRFCQQVVLLHPDPAVAAAAGVDLHLAGDLGPTLDALTAALPEPPAGRIAARDRVHALEAAHAGFAQRPAIGAVDMVKLIEAGSRLKSSRKRCSLSRSSASICLRCVTST